MYGRELTLLTEGSIELLGLIPRSSNQTFLVQVTCGEDIGYAVYKPESGERPLSDFEPGLYKRERAAYLLSESLGWGFVPLTVIREDAPLGVGSLQWFIECDFREHYFTLYEDARKPTASWPGSPCSTSSPTTPTARAATSCAATTAASGASTTGSASRQRSSYAP